MKTRYVVMIALGAFVLGMTFSMEQIESALPPTRAWTNIGTNDTDPSTGGWVNATSYKGDLYIVSDGSILIEPFQFDPSSVEP